MAESVVVPGARDVRASLDTPDAETCVVACPPHPQMGGNRSDSRLRAVSDALAPGVACLRIDYGAWDEGHGERDDAVAALGWAAAEFERVGLFGYSFGGAVALLAAAAADPVVLSTLAPTARLDDDLDAVAALDRVDCPVQVVYGERDTTAEWEPVVERARALGHAIERVPGDHFFVGQTQTVGALAADFLRDGLRP
ncbi:MAG: dienelactone hydrolase family protein [Haloarculaceae archaeon]